MIANEHGGQIIHSFFCRALYDYQSNDLSSLSFRKGNIIEVLTQLESGWWDGLLNDERGWFPSNYVVQISDEDAAADLMNTGMLQEPVPGSTNAAEWMRDEGDYSLYRSASVQGDGIVSGDWIPEVTNDGQIYYVNSVTGETSRELPMDEYEPQSTVFQSQDTIDMGSRSRSNSTATTFNASPREPAGFGVRRRSNTPEGWIKRLADDGMSYYYINSSSGEMRWTPPSPAVNGVTRLRADSDTTNYDSHRASVYSDTSDIHPFMGPDVAKSLSGGDAPFDDTNAAENAARRLQQALQPAPADSFSRALETTHRSIQAVLDTITKDPDNITEHINDTVQSLRTLLYLSGTLVAGIKPHVSNGENEDVVNLRLKPLQRKVTATLSKVVLSARAARFNPNYSLGRVQQDARDLDQTVRRFAEEVQAANLSGFGTKRLTGILVSGEGAAGIGVGLVGAGIGGGWKGLGFVPSDEVGPHRKLGASLIAEFQDQKSILDEKAQILASCFSANNALTLPEVRDASRDFLSRLFIFTNALADTNVAQHVDVDGIKRNVQSSLLANEDSYVQSINRARLLVRSLEATTQALYDGGALFLLAAQDPGSMVKVMSEAIPSVAEHINKAVNVIGDLYAVGQEQADLSSADQSAYDYPGSLSWRASRVNPLDVDMMANLSLLASASTPTLADSEAEDVIDMESAFTTKSRTNVNGGISSYAPAASTNLDQLRNRPSSTTDVASVDTITNGDVHTNGTRIAPEDHVEALDEEDRDEVLEEAPKKPVANSKIEKFFGGDAPRGYLTMRNKGPWYLRADYQPQDIILNPDGSVRAGTLSALIEHLTDHAYRDTNYIRTFLLTFKSFSSIEEVFELLVSRFNTPPPTGLTDAQLAEWKKEKQDVFQIRVLNILKQIIMEDDVLDQNDTQILTSIRDFAISVQEISPPAKLLVRVAERALNGEDAIIKTLTKSVHTAPPPSILPRIGRKLKLLDIDALELARQLTIMESNLYNRIRVMECLQRAKEQKVKDSNRDNISNIIERTNQFAAWLNSQILDKEDARKRAAIIKYFITVADRCRTMHNYSTMAALVSGLNTPPIRRLKRTWDQVGGRAMAMLEICEKTFDSNKNFNNYRTTLARVEPPCVPFLGVYLTTLVFINEGSKDILPPPQPALLPGQAPPPPPTGLLINFAKRQKAAEVIREIKNWQTKPYNLTAVPVIQSFVEEALAGVSGDKNPDQLSDEFWNKSLQLEPREREDEKMARLLQESGFL